MSPNTMHIQKELGNKHSIKAYDSSGVQIGDKTYRQSLIISSHHLVTDWPVFSLNELKLLMLEPFFAMQPDVIIIGHQGNQPCLAIETQIALSQKRIGIECMNLGAACRTYNLLLNEGRAVAMGIILSLSPNI